MRNLFLLAGIMVLLAAASPAQDKLAIYTNDRFFFSIEYPSDLLKMLPPPDNDDGRTFRSADKQIEMQVWGEYNAESRTLQERYERDLKGFTEKPAYMVSKRDWYVLSGTKDDKIFYEKVLVRRRGDTDIFFTFTIEYPAAQKAKFDPIVKRMADSFKFDATVDN
ncbi:MAG: hypothetical protein ACRD43_12560 [Pyrinomonadaceae bacterium]